NVAVYFDPDARILVCFGDEQRDTDGDKITALRRLRRTTEEMVAASGFFGSWLEACLTMPFVYCKV
ncbi:MAG TPA: hypothetical protein VFG95_00030, partial [Nitrospiria bacterium]|nr:hypothetical protein [Nitrospiria bacterium]